MKFQRSLSGEVFLTFVDLEVEAVSSAYKEHNAHLKDLGNDSSVSPQDENYARWRSSAQMMIPASDPSYLLDKLGYFVESTEDRVSIILDDVAGSHDRRIAAVARRYELAHMASVLLTEIQLASASDRPQTSEP